MSATQRALARLAKATHRAANAQRDDFALAPPPDTGATVTHPTIASTHTYTGRTPDLTTWLTGTPHHFDDGQLVIPAEDHHARPQPGWTLVRWTDGVTTVASPRSAARTYGPDGLWGRLQRAEAELRRVRNTNQRLVTERVTTAQQSDDWTPPPPGSTREQLPDHLLALIDVQPYQSTACQTAHECERAAEAHRVEQPWLRAHADDLHARCRLNNKFTGQLCVCPCHPHTHDKEQ